MSTSTFAGVDALPCFSALYFYDPGNVSKFISTVNMHTTEHCVKFSHGDLLERTVKEQ